MCWPTSTLTARRWRPARRAEDSSIALDKLAFYEKLKDVDMPVLLGALAVATEQNQRALGKLLADTRFEDMFGLPAVINPMEAAVAEAQGKLIEWKNSDRDYSRYYCDDASAYLTEYSDIRARHHGAPPPLDRRAHR